MQFDYRAIDADGRRVSGQLEALNLLDLENRLRQLGLAMITGRPPKAPRAFRRNGIRRRELINFCFHLEQLAHAGVPLLESLADLRDSLEHPRLRQVVAGLSDSIAGGQTLSQAMAAYPRVFDPVFASLIRAGETSGELPAVLASLADSLKWEDELAAHTRKLLLYPAFVAAIVLATGLFLLLYLVPQLKPFIFAMGQALPPQTAALFFVSELTVNHWPLLLVAPPAALAALHLALRTNPHLHLGLDRLKLRLPVIGDIVAKIILARFAATFAMLYAAGIPVLEAIRTSQDIVGNRIIRRGLQEVERAVGEGRNVAAAFQETALFPPLVVRMLRVGESTGGLDRALNNVSYFYSRDVREAVGRAQALIEPALTLVMGVLLGWIMLAVLGPLYDVIGGARW